MKSDTTQYNNVLSITGDVGSYIGKIIPFDLKFSVCQCMYELECDTHACMYRQLISQLAN